MKQINLFAGETQLERLSKLGDSLERLKVIDFESFRPTLTEGMKKELECYTISAVDKSPKIWYNKSK